MNSTFRELQNEMLTVRHNLDGVYSKYVHPGFGNVENPKVVVFEEAPSKSHFTGFSADIASMDINGYVDHYENTYRESILGWPPFEVFLEPVFSEFDVILDGILDEVYMTSVVKNPVRSKNKSSNLRRAFREIWKPFVQRELNILSPDIVITAGRPAAHWISPMLGVSAGDAESISISKERWWGISPFQAEASLIHVPHWSAKSYDGELKRRWDEVINITTDALRNSGYSPEIEEDVENFEKEPSHTPETDELPTETIIDVMPGEVEIRHRDHGDVSWRRIENRLTTVALNERAAGKHGIQRGTRVVVSSPESSGIGYVDRVERLDTFWVVFNDGSRETVTIDSIARVDGGTPYWGNYENP